MKQVLPYKPFAVLALILAFLPGRLPAQEEGSGEGEDKADYSEVPCGRLAGKPVFYDTKTEHDYGTRHNESWTNACSIDLGTISKGKNRPDTAFEPLLSWTEEVSGPMADNQLTVESCKADKNSLSLLSGNSVIAEFAYQKGRLALAPGFRKRILDGMEKHAAIRTEALQTILSGLEDPQIHEVLRAYAIGDSVAQGEVDYALLALEEFSREAQDKNVRNYCRRLSDSLAAWKKSEQPVFLVDARKAGKILAAPVYPPLDAPTVFWKDSSLCVVQEEKGKPNQMRAFDPRTGKWGPKVKLKYPESGMSRMFEKNTGTWSMGCQYETFCWSEKMGPITDDPCDGISCGPLIRLDDSAGGSVQSREDLAKAGGSCAAGDGSLEFLGGGMVRYLDSAKVAWKVIEGDLRYGTRPYGFTLSREYPVVVAPNQDWIAYALGTKDGKGIELWVARLKYRK